MRNKLVNQYVVYGGGGEVIDDGKIHLGEYASNGVELMRIKHGQPVGAKTMRFDRLRKELAGLRALYAQRRNVGTTDELRNIKERGEVCNTQIAQLESSFAEDLEHFGNFELTRAEFIRRWANHNDVGLYNSTVLITEPNTGAVYYVQF